MESTGTIKASMQNCKNYSSMCCFALTFLLLVTMVLSFAVPLQAANEGPNIPISIVNGATAPDTATLLGDDQQNPSVIALPDKNKWFVVWEDWRNWSTTGADIYGRFINGDGSYCGDEIAISTQTGNQTVPVLAYRNRPDADPQVTGTDKIMIAWQDTRGATAEGYVYYDILDVSKLAGDCSSGFTFQSDPTNAAPLGYPFTYTSIDSDNLRSRKLPAIAFDNVRDQFWVTWVESRDELQRVKEKVKPKTTNEWTTGEYFFGDSNFVAYGVVAAGTGAIQSVDILRNSVKNPAVRTVRLISWTLDETDATRGTATYTYEYFTDINNVKVVCDDSSPETLIVWEGVKGEKLLTSNLVDNVVSDEELSEVEDTDKNVHVYAIFDKNIDKSVVYTQWIDYSSGASSYYPAAGYDSTHRKFLVAWEDRDKHDDGSGDGIHSKIFGQLLYSGGGLYAGNIAISFQDTNNDGTQDENILNSNQTRPQVAIDPTNQRFFVTWQDGRNSQVSLENLDIYGQYVDSEGSLRGDNYAVCTEPANQYNPVTAYNSGSHQFLSVWKDARNLNTTNSDIYGQRLTMGQPQLILLHDDNTPLVPPLLDFASLQTGEVSTLTVKMKNTGDSTIKIDYVTPLESPYVYVGLPGELGSEADGKTIDLVPGATYNLYIEFKPEATGTFLGSFTIYSDATNLAVNLQGAAVPTPPVVTPDVKVDVSPKSYPYGNVNIGESATEILTFTNTGKDDVTFGETIVPEGFAVTGMSGTIKAGTSFVALVTFTPTQPRSYSGTLMVFFADGVAPLQIDLSGVGRGNIIASVTPPGDISFGNVAVGEDKSANLVFTNTGNVDLVITAIDLPDGAGFKVSGLPATIPVYGTLNVTATFSPKLPRVYNSTLRVLYEHGVPSSEIKLSGVGVYNVDNVIEVSDEINLGRCNIGNSKSANLRFINNGAVAVNISAVDLPEGVFAVSGIPGSIPAYGVLDALVTFTPLLEQDYDITLRVLYDQGVVTSDIKLKGSGVDISAPAISVAPQSFAFGNTALGTTKTETLVVTNTGNVDLEIVGVDLPGALFAVEGISNGTLAAGMSTVGIVTFTPVSVGDFSGILRLLFNHDLPPQEIIMQGSGVDIDVSPTTLEFPNSDVGSNTVLNVTITNSSVEDIQVKGAVTGTDSYSVSGIAAGDIIRASGGSLTCQVTFKPVSSGYLEDGLYFNVGPVQDLANIPPEEIDWGTQYVVLLKGVANADFVVADYDTYTADIDYKVSVSASTEASGQLFVLFSHDPLSQGDIYALTPDGSLKLFPYNAVFGWQNLWYKAGAAPGMKLDLSQVDFRELGCTQCQGEKVDSGDDDFHFGDIIITPPDNEPFNNASDFKYMPGTLYMGTYVKDASTSGPFDFNKGLLEMQSLHINSLAGTWQVTSEYYGVKRVHPTNLVVTEDGNGNISAVWPGYNVQLFYGTDASGYVMTFSLPYNGRIYNYTYNITSLTADKFSGTYTCVVDGVVLEDAPVSGVRLQ